MKAMVLHGIGERLRFEEVPEPSLRPDEILVETRSCGLCGTDLHILEGHAYVPPFPHILGHEPSGIVAAVGSRVEGFRTGDRVAPNLFETCGSCRYCLTGRHTLCSNLQGLIGVLSNGAFAEFFKAPAENFFKLPDNVGFEAGGLISDAVVTALHAYRRSGLSAGQTAVVIGAGGVGQMIIQFLRAGGIHSIAVDLAERKLQVAREMGAQLAFLSNNSQLASKIQDFTSDDDGVHAVFNCVGTAETMGLSADLVMTGGRIVVIGETPEFPEIDTIRIAQRELEIAGSRNGTRQDTLDAIAMVADGTIEPLVSKRFPLEQANEALVYLKSGEALGRVVLTFGK